MYVNRHAILSLSNTSLMTPGANVSETTNGTRTKWPTSGGSISINGSHEFAFTYVNLALGRNVTNFNISLVENFNQTGAGELCLKDNLGAALKEGLEKSNITEESLDGLDASLQVIQIAHSGSALYNVSVSYLSEFVVKDVNANSSGQCMDITFSKDAKVLEDDKCKNGTGVGGTEIGASQAQEGSEEPQPSDKAGAAASVKPFVGSGVVAVAMAMLLL